MGIVQADQLKFWLDKITNDPELLAEDVYGNKIPLGSTTKRFVTHCNQHVQRVAQQILGENPFDGMLANQMYSWLSAHWQPVDTDQAKSYADIGDLVIAAWANPSGHGHVSVVYPGKPLVFSGKWQKYCPFVASVDRVCPVSANWAFGDPPDYFRAGKVDA